MEETKKALWADYEERKNQMKGVEIGSQEYADLARDLDDIRNELIKVEQIESEDRKTKRNNKIALIGHVLTAGVGLIGIGVSLAEWFGDKKIQKETIRNAWEFDKSGNIITSSPGKVFIPDTMKNKSKR